MLFCDIQEKAILLGRKKISNCQQRGEAEGLTTEGYVELAGRGATGLLLILIFMGPGARLKWQSAYLASAKP
jgi:hypothetical protein